MRQSFTVHGSDRPPERNGRVSHEVMRVTSDPERRRQILEAAERLLRHYGTQKTTIAEIAREAAVGVGTVYLEFPSKDAIVEALTSVRHAKVLAAMSAAASRGAKSFAERFSAVMDARAEAYLALSDEGMHARDLVHCVSPAVKQVHARFQDDERALLASLFRDGMAAAELAQGSPERLAATVLRAYVSFSPPWVFAQTRDDAVTALRTMHDLVLRGLLARAPVASAASATSRRPRRAR